MNKAIVKTQADFFKTAKLNRAFRFYKVIPGWGFYRAHGWGQSEYERLKAEFRAKLNPIERFTRKQNIYDGFNVFSVTPKRNWFKRWLKKGFTLPQMLSIFKRELSASSRFDLSGI
jgi:hypothetical protein